MIRYRSNLAFLFFVSILMTHQATGWANTTNGRLPATPVLAAWNLAESYTPYPKLFDVEPQVYNSSAFTGTSSVIDGDLAVVVRSANVLIDTASIVIVEQPLFGSVDDDLGYESTLLVEDDMFVFTASSIEGTIEYEFTVFISPVNNKFTISYQGDFVDDVEEVEGVFFQSFLGVIDGNCVPNGDRIYPVTVLVDGMAVFNLTECFGIHLFVGDVSNDNVDEILDRYTTVHPGLAFAAYRVIYDQGVAFRGHSFVSLVFNDRVRWGEGLTGAAAGAVGGAAAGAAIGFWFGGIGAGPGAIIGGIIGGIVGGAIAEEVDHEWDPDNLEYNWGNSILVGGGAGTVAGGGSVLFLEIVMMTGGGGGGSGGPGGILNNPTVRNKMASALGN